MCGSARVPSSWRTSGSPGAPLSPLAPSSLSTPIPTRWWPECPPVPSADGSASTAAAHDLPLQTGSQELGRCRDREYPREGRRLHHGPGLHHLPHPPGIRHRRAPRPYQCHHRPCRRVRHYGCDDPLLLRIPGPVRPRHRGQYRGANEHRRHARHRSPSHVLLRGHLAPRLQDPRVPCLCHPVALEPTLVGDHRDPLCALTRPAADPPLHRDINRQAGLVARSEHPIRRLLRLEDLGTSLLHLHHHRLHRPFSLRTHPLGGGLPPFTSHPQIDARLRPSLRARDHGDVHSPLRGPLLSSGLRVHGAGRHLLLGVQIRHGPPRALHFHVLGGLGRQAIRVDRPTRKRGDLRAGPYVLRLLPTPPRSGFFPPRAAHAPAGRGPALPRRRPADPGHRSFLPLFWHVLPLPDRYLHPEADQVPRPHPDRDGLPQPRPQLPPYPAAALAGRGPRHPPLLRDDGCRRLRHLRPTPPTAL